MILSHTKFPNTPLLLKDWNKNYQAINLLFTRINALKSLQNEQVALFTSFGDFSTLTCFYCQAVAKDFSGLIAKVLIVILKLNYASHIGWRMSRLNHLCCHKINVDFTRVIQAFVCETVLNTKVSLKLALLCSELSKNKDCPQGSSWTYLLSVFLYCGKELGEGGNFVLQPQILAGGFPSNPKSKITGNLKGK